MGLNVGGLYVAVKAGITQARVVSTIERYWLDAGARPSAKDPLSFEPLELEKTGELAFLVAPPLPDVEAENEWIAVYDSERYHSDVELARHLAKELDTRVFSFAMNDATNDASARWFGESRKVKRSEVESTVTSLPHAFLYFNRVRDDLSDQDIATLSFLAFEGIPHRPKKAYSGPSPDQLDSNQKLARAVRLAEARDAKGLLALGDDHQVAFDVIAEAVENANLRDPAELAFVAELCPFVVELSDSHCRTEILEVAARTGNGALLDAIAPGFVSYQASLTERRALEVGAEGEHGVALAMLEGITRSPSTTATAWTNALYYYIQTFRAPSVAKERLDALLEGAERAGPSNAAIFRNVACLYVLRGEHDRALGAVENAIRYGYDDLEQLRGEELFDPIREHPRFVAAFAEKPVTSSIEHLAVERGKKKLLVPAVGLHLWFPPGYAAAPPIAELLASVHAEFPEMFRYYRPSGVFGLEETKKGKVTRDLNELRKKKPEYGFCLQYDDAKGAASELRVQVELDDELPGALLLHLPLALARDPDALFRRFSGYAQKLPFTAGHAGYVLTAFCHGQLVGPTTDAQAELHRIAPSFFGLGLSPLQLGLLAKKDYVSPGWITFLNKALAKRVSLGGLDVTALDGGAVAIRAAPSPFVGAKGSPADLGSFPAVLRALSGVLPPPDENDPDARRWPVASALT